MHTGNFLHRTSSVDQNTHTRTHSIAMESCFWWKTQTVDGCKHLFMPYTRYALTCKDTTNQSHGCLWTKMQETRLDLGLGLGPSGLRTWALLVIVFGKRRRQRAWALGLRTRALWSLSFERQEDTWPGPGPWGSGPDAVLSLPFAKGRRAWTWPWAQSQVLGLGLSSFKRS